MNRLQPRKGRLVPESDYMGRLTGREVCVSCNAWNCWHLTGQPCDIAGCECSHGHPDGAGNPGDRVTVRLRDPA